MHVAATPCGDRMDVAPKTGSTPVHLFPRRKAGEPRSVHSRGRAPLKVDGHAVASLFGRPQHEAAKQLGISLTAIKQVCRKLGIKRWPYMRQKKQGSARAATRRARAVVSPTAGGHCGAAASGIDKADESEPVLTPRSTASGAPTECNSPIRQACPWAGPAPSTCAQESSALGAVCALPAPNPDLTLLPLPWESEESDERWIDRIPAHHHEVGASTGADADDKIDEHGLVRVDHSYPCAVAPLQHLACSDDVVGGDDLSWLLSFDKSLSYRGIYGRIDPRCNELCVLELACSM